MSALSLNHSNKASINDKMEQIRFYYEGHDNSQGSVTDFFHNYKKRSQTMFSKKLMPWMPKKVTSLGI